MEIRQEGNQIYHWLKTRATDDQERYLLEPITAIEQ